MYIKSKHKTTSSERIKFNLLLYLGCVFSFLTKNILLVFLFLFVVVGCFLIFFFNLSSLFTCLCIHD